MGRGRGSDKSCKKVRIIEGSRRSEEGPVAEICGLTFGRGAEREGGRLEVHAVSHLHPFTYTTCLPDQDIKTTDIRLSQESLSLRSLTCTRTFTHPQTPLNPPGQWPTQSNASSSPLHPSTSTPSHLSPRPEASTPAPGQHHPSPPHSRSSPPGSESSKSQLPAHPWTATRYQ